MKQFLDDFCELANDRNLENMIELLAGVRKISKQFKKIELLKYPHPETHGTELRCYQRGWNDAIDRILGMDLE